MAGIDIDINDKLHVVGVSVGCVWMWSVWHGEAGWTLLLPGLNGIWPGTRCICMPINAYRVMPTVNLCQTCCDNVCVAFVMFICEKFPHQNTTQSALQNGFCVGGHTVNE